MAKLEYLTDEIENVTIERDRLARQLLESRTKESQIKGKNETLLLRMKDVQSRHNDLDQVEASLRKQLDMFKKQVIELSEQKEDAENGQANLRGAVNGLQANHDALASELNDLKTEAALSKQERQFARSRLVDSQSELDLLRKENNSLRNRLFESESGRNQYSATNDQLGSVLTETTDKLAIVSREQETVSSHLSEVTRERDLFEAEIDHLKRRVRMRTFRILAVVIVVIGIGCFAIWANYTMSDTALRDQVTKAEKDVAFYLKNLKRKEDKNRSLTRDIVENKKQIVRAEEENETLSQDIKELNGTILNIRNAKDGRIQVLGDTIKWAEKTKVEDLRLLTEKKDMEIKGLKSRLGKRDTKITELKRTKARAILPLIEAFDHPDIYVRSAVADALMYLTGKQYAKQEEWREWWAQNRNRYLDLK